MTKGCTARVFYRPSRRGLGRGSRETGQAVPWPGERSGTLESGDWRPKTAEARSYPFWIVRLARLVLDVFFRRIDVVGHHRPSSVPGGILYVANHNNGLVDPLLVIGHLPGRPRFLAKSTLWRIPVLRPFLGLGRVIPVFRRQDPGFDPERNEATFERCREVLAAGGSVALFPEGTSHSEPRLAELRTGAARIVLGGPDDALASTRIVPVGLLFDAGHRFRSAVLVKVGEPFTSGQVVPDARDGADAVRRLTDHIGAGLRDVTLEYPSWEEARLIERAVDVYLHPERALPARSPLGERHAWLRGFVEEYQRLRESDPERLQALARRVSRYDRLLDAFGLTDAQVASAYPGRDVGRWTLETGMLLVALLPLALLGAALSWLPYRICGALGSLVADDPDQPASYKVFGGLVLFPLTWTLEVVLAWRLGGPAWGVGILAAALAGGWAALRFRDRWRLLREEARAYLILRRSDRLRDELRARRRAIREELVRLAEDWEGEKAKWRKGEKARGQKGEKAKRRNGQRPED